MDGRRILIWLGVGLGCCGSAEAAATAEGAKAIADGYAAYFSRDVVDQGVVTVAPRGDDYVVTWDLQKEIDLIPPNDDKYRIEPFSYIISPAADGGWTISAEKFPSIDIDVADGDNRVVGRIDVLGFALGSVYDARATEWLRSSLSAASIAMKFHLATPSPGGDEAFVIEAPALQLRARDATDGGGVDVAAAYQSAATTGSISTPTPNAGAAPLEVTIGGGGHAATYGVEGLRALEMGELWKFMVARADATPSTFPTTDELRPYLRATLPVWRRLHMEFTERDFAVTSRLLSISMKSFTQSLGIGGLTSESGVQFGLGVVDLSLGSPLAPSWFASLAPASLEIDTHVALRDLDKIAELALDDASFGSGDLTPETREKIGESLLAGHPTLALAPGRFKTPLIDVAFQGDISIDPAAPGAKVVVSADSLDKTVELLQEIAPTLPAAQQALLGVAFVKGLATTDPTGRLVWTIEAKDGDVTVNGALMPKGNP